jgi:hypothetical protein
MRSLASVLALAVAIPLAGCDTAPAAPVPPALNSSDLAGSWTMVFQASSAPSRLVVGTLVISDRSDPQQPAYLTAEFSADFRPALGRQVSCLATPQAALVRLDSTTVQLLLTPNAADCGLFAGGQLERDAVTGDWVEPSITSRPQSNGTFRMTRTDGRR